MDQFTETTLWDGWERWYFGSDYVEAAGLPSEHWAIASAGLEEAPPHTNPQTHSPARSPAHSPAQYRAA